MLTLIKVHNKAMKFLKDFLYHRKHKKEALRALKNITNENNWEISSDLKEKIKNYSKTHFGSKKYSYWLMVYTAFNKEFKSGWIPDNYFGKVLLSDINGIENHVSEIKTLSKRILNSSHVPDSYYIINGRFYDENYVNVNEQVILDDLNKNKIFFVKPNYSNQGKGIIKITKSNYNEVNLDSLENSVIQYGIKQHSWFNDITPRSVATVRITTYINEENKLKYAAGTLRVGRSESEVVQSKTAIKVAVKNEEGALSDFGIDPSWKKHHTHPDSKFTFKNKKIPQYKKAVDICLNHHKILPHFSVIGWDLAIDENENVIIMEYNTRHPDIKFHEASLGPILSDLF